MDRGSQDTSMARVWTCFSAGVDGMAHLWWLYVEWKLATLAIVWAKLRQWVGIWGITKSSETWLPKAEWKVFETTQGW